MGDSDLTPNTEPAQEGGGNSPSSVQGVRSGACTDPYVVRSGDTLSAIARLCAVSLADLLAANPDITNPDLIHVDQRIRIPGGSSAPQAARPAAAPSPTPTAAASEPRPTPAPVQPDQPEPAEKSEDASVLEAMETASAGQ